MWERIIRRVENRKGIMVKRKEGTRGGPPMISKFE